MATKDLLQEWHVKMSEVSWKNVMFQHPTMNIGSLRFIYDTLKKFFPEPSYVLDNKPGDAKIGWLHSYLSILDPNFVAYAKELAFIIDYYEKITEGSDPLNLRPKNYELEGLKDRFFELFVNLVLRRAGFNNNPNFSYYIDSVEKPVDAYFEYEGSGYIIECAKIYDTKQSSLLKTVQRLILKIFVKEGKVLPMYADVQPCGYVLFKSTKDSAAIANKIAISFSECFQEYIKNMRARSEYISSSAKLETDEYKIFIGSNIAYNMNEYKHLLNEYDMAIMFQCDLKANSVQQSTFSITAQSRRDLQKDYDLISKRIKSKINQHAKALKFRQIIFIELEEGISVSGDERPLYITFPDMNFSKFEKFISERVSIFFLFKRYRATRAYYETKFLCHHNFNPTLANRISKLNFDL
jgi:hypothetical protein